MRIAALYDVHGNLPALEAVLGDVHDADVDAVVVGGDVLPGPMACQTLERLLALEVPTHFLFGNGEVAVLAEMDGRPSRLPVNYQPLIAWNARQVVGHAQTLRAWPMTVALEVAGLGRVLFCHATPRNESDIFVAREFFAHNLLHPPSEAQMLAAYEAAALT